MLGLSKVYLTMSEKPFTPKTSHGPESKGHNKDTESVSDTSLGVKKRNARRTKREVYNDEFEAIGAYYAQGPRGGDFDILKIVSEHVHKGEKRLRIITRSRESVAGNVKVEIGDAYAPIDQVEIFPVEDQIQENKGVELQGIDDLPEDIKSLWGDITERSSAKADQRLQEHGHNNPKAYSIFLQQARKHAKDVGDDKAHTIWDFGIYEGKSTWTQYWDDQGLPHLNSFTDTIPVSGPGNVNTNSTEADSRPENATAIVATPNSSPTDEIKKEIKRIQNSKLGRFMVNQVRKIHFQLYSPGPAGPVEEQPPLNEQLTFDFDTPLSDTQDKPRPTKVDIQPVIRPAVKLPEVNLDNSWKGMDPMDDAEPSTPEVAHEAKPQTNEVVEPLVETKKSGKPTAVKEFLNGTSKAKQETKRHKVKRITATFLGALAIGYIAYTTGNNNAQTIRQNSDNLWAQIEAQDQPQQSENSSVAPSLDSTPEAPVVTEQIVPEASPEEPVVTERSIETSQEPIAPIDLSKIHDSPGVAQPLEVFKVQQGTSVANAIGDYVHNVQNIDLTDAQKQRIYELLSAKYGKKIIDVQNDDNNVYRDGSDLYISSTGNARWFNESVKISLDELVREILAP